EVTCRMLVQDDEIGDQSLEPPVGMRLEELANQGQFIGFRDAGEHDRPVARNPVPPEGLLTLAVVGDGTGGTETLTGINNVGGQALIEVKVLGGDAQVPELNLAMGPGQLESPVHAVKVVILIRKGEGMLPAFGDRRGISD